MANLGTKYECIQCSVKFYDLGKPVAICPSCGTNQGDPGKKTKHAVPHRLADLDDPVDDEVGTDPGDFESEEIEVVEEEVVEEDAEK